MLASHPTEQQLRSALASGDFLKAQQLLPVYTQQVAMLLSRPASIEERRSAIQTFQDLLSLARVMRAHIASQLSSLRRQVAHRYQIPSPEKHAWRFDA